MDLSGLFVAISSIGVAWVAAHYGFRATQETTRREARAEDERYRRERLKEQDQINIEPLRQEISSLQSFMDALAYYHLVVYSDAFNDDEEKAAEVELVKSSGVVYRHLSILDAWRNYYPSNVRLETFQQVRYRTEAELKRQREELKELLEELLPIQVEPTQVVKHGANDGPLVRLALRVEAWLKK